MEELEHDRDRQHQLALAQELLARHMADVGSRGSSRRSSAAGDGLGGGGGGGSCPGSPCGSARQQPHEDRQEPLLAQVETLITEHRLSRLEQERLRSQLGAASQALKQAQVKEDRLSAMEQQR